MNHLPNEVTGWEAGVDALMRVGGVLLTPDAANALSLVLTLTVTPFVKADVLADISDDLAELALAELAPTDRGCPRLRALDRWRVLTDASNALDLASHEIRKALTR